MTSQVNFIIKPEEQEVNLASRVLQMYFEFRDNEEDFSDNFLEAYALHLKLDEEMVRRVYDSGKEEARILLIVHPEYVVIPTFDEMH